ncbi:MAG: thermonuclease family protein [Candidatus Competibacter sp.]|nr:thermonuclease family protein [Candidatus Competibacter sp.]
MLARDLVLILSLLGSAVIPVAAETLAGRVVGVSDGDTITLLVTGRDQVKVRLAWIDAPETGQPYGQQAKQALSALVFGREVLVTGSGHDRYGRTLGVVTVAGADVQSEQVRRGLAWVYRQYSNDSHLLALEGEARAARRGLWADLNPVPPWAWRHGEQADSAAKRAPPSMSLTCGSKRRCGEMANCEEARYFLTVCGVRSLDGDGDGTPCDSLCRRP